MQSNTVKGSLSLPDQALLLCLDTVLAQFQTLSDQRFRRGIRHPLATTLFPFHCTFGLTSRAELSHCHCRVG